MSKGKAVKKRPPQKAPSKKKSYKVRNWHEYNESLVRRGSLEFWIEQGLIKSWEVKIIPPAKRKKGAQTKYSDHAIETTRLIGKVYHQCLRQTEGFARSIFEMVKLKLSVPDHSALSRRGNRLKVRLPVKDKEHVIAIIDSTGLKVYGEGEWKVRKHGYSKRRTWVKLHVSVDTDGEVRAALITDNAVDDAEAGVELLDQQRVDNIEEVDADGAYDKSKFYDTCLEQNIPKIAIPPRIDAKIWVHGNRKGDKHPRDENLRAIRRASRHKWKQATGYHKRSLVETTMYRTKTIFGEKINSRNSDNQKTEVMLILKALNLMTHSGMPDSYVVT
jgi:hypothetical protein